MRTQFYIHGNNKSHKSITICQKLRSLQRHPKNRKRLFNQNQPLSKIKKLQGKLEKPSPLSTTVMFLRNKMQLLIRLVNLSHLFTAGQRMKKMALINLNINQWALQTIYCNPKSILLDLKAQLETLIFKPKT